MHVQANGTSNPILISYLMYVCIKEGENLPLKKSYLTLNVPITTAADDIHKYFFIVFSEKIRLDIQVNPLRGFT